MAVAPRTRPAPLSPVPPMLYSLPDRDAGSGYHPTSGRVVSPAPSAVVTALLLTGITVAATFLRLWHSTSQSLRIDESFSMRWAAWPLTPAYNGKMLLAPSLFQATASDVHPPGYLLLLHVWMQAVGTDLALLRLPSELAGLLAVPALYLLGASLYSRIVGLGAATLGAFSPLWIWHAQEVRMYPFLLLFCIVSTYGLVEALEHRRWWGWPVLFAGSVIALYMQYFAIFVLFAQGVFVALHWRHYTRGQLLAWFSTMTLAALAFLPWALFVLHTPSAGSDPSLQKPGLYTPLIILTGFLFGYLSTPLTSQLLAAWPLLIMVALGLTIFAGRMTRRSSLMWLLFLVPVVLPYLVSLTIRPFIAERYLIVATPALYILLAVAFARLGRGLPRFVVAALTLAILLLSLGVAETSAANPNQEDYRSAVAYIQAHARPGDIVALDSAFNQDAYSYYAHLNLPAYQLPPGYGTGRNLRLDTAALNRYMGAMEAGHKNLWVVYYLETNFDHAVPGGVIRPYLATHTSGHQVIYGGPYQRNQDRYPGSYINVQLVRYSLIPTVAATEQVRPETIQEVRTLTYIAPTLRQPFASPFGTPGERWNWHGEPAGIPQAARVWRFAAVPQSATHDIHAAYLTLFNPNSVAITALVNTKGRGGIYRKPVRVPAASNVDIKLAAWGKKDQDAAIAVSSNYVLVPQRTFVGHGDEYSEYPLLGVAKPMGQHSNSSAIRPMLRVIVRSDYMQSRDARIAISYAPDALVRVTVTVPGQSPDSFYDTTDAHGRLTLAVPAPRGLARGHGRITARVVVQGNATQGGSPVSRMLVVADGR